MISFVDGVDVEVAVAFENADTAVPTFTDITRHVRGEVYARVGRESELETTQPGELRFAVENTDREFDSFYEGARYATTYLDLPGVDGKASTVVDPLTGEIDVRVRVALADWTPAATAFLAGQWSSGDLGWKFEVVQTFGVLLFSWSTDGTNIADTASSTATTGIGDGTTAWVRATYLPDDGGGNYEVTFYTSTAVTPTGGDWVQLGSAVVDTATGATFATSAPLTVGADAGGNNPTTGQVYRTVVYSDLTETTKVVDADFTVGVGGGRTSFTDPAGLAWTFGGDAVSVYVANYIEPNKAVRVRASYDGTTYDEYYGYIDSWARRYDDPDAYVYVTATDAFKIFAKYPLPSAYEIEVRNDSPKNWWRLDEVDGETMADSSGNGHDGIYEGAIDLGTTHESLVPYDDNRAMTFDGTSLRGRVTDLAARVSALPLAVEFWIDGPVTVVQASAVVRQASGNTSDGWFVSIVDSGGGQINVFGVTKFVDLTSRQVVDVDLPAHVVYRRTATPVHELYINGVAASSAGPTPVADTFNDMWVMGNPKGIVRYTDGIADEIAVYDTDLSPTRIAAHYEAGTTAWYGDTGDERAARLLDWIGWPAALRDLDVCQSLLGSANIKGTSLLDVLRAIALAEGGNVYMQGDGTLKIRSRQAILTETRYKTSNATFGDDGAELRYADLTIEPSDHWIRNDVTYAREGGTAQRVTDQTSIDRHLPAGFSRTGLINALDTDMRGQAEMTLARYKDPLERIDSIVIKPRNDPAGLFPQVLGRQLEDRITVKRRPPGGGDPIVVEAHIEQIEHRFGVDLDWTTTWTLSPADTQSYWIWDDAGTSWDDDDRWAY